MQPEAVVEERLAHHFPNLEQQTHASRLGMWIFLSTEILLFTALFTAYSVYRYLFYDTFQAASRHIDTGIGTANTYVLITSSLTVALAFHFTKENRSKLAALCLAITVLFGVTFMVLKAVEYTHHFREGQLPGQYYTYQEVQGPGVTLFFTLYFFMTGLHGLHVLVGMGVLSVVGVRAWRGEYGSEYHTPVELGGLYWHLVDLIWIFLYPLLYLI